ncbi:MAG: ABC transporter ATP-binding protein [Spirochaetaceae bacterium]|nr:ABC transporter ATP-binding protein [Spirochaetaceae bacterium]
MIDIRNLNFSYPDTTALFSDFNWHVKDGESWSVLGLSGSGKTTLLLLLAGLIRPPAGEILISGNKITRPRPQTGLVLQNHGLLPWETVEKNIRLGFRIRKFYGPDGKHSPEVTKFDKKQETDAVEYWLDRLSIGHLRNKYPSKISGGQKQRAAIARTMVLKPNLLLLDEPFSSLDLKTREDMQNLILDLKRENTITIITVTHNLEEAVYLGKKLLVLQNEEKKVLMFNNPGAESSEYRHRKEYSKMCLELRKVMETLK